MILITGATGTVGSEVVKRLAAQGMDGTSISKTVSTITGAPKRKLELASFAEGLSVVANEDEISLNPIFISHLKIPNVVMVPIADSGATWDVFVAWQRGKTSGPLRALVDALMPNPAR